MVQTHSGRETAKWSVETELTEEAGAAAPRKPTRPLPSMLRREEALPRALPRAPPPESAGRSAGAVA